MGNEFKGNLLICLFFLRLLFTLFEFFFFIFAFFFFSKKFNFIRLYSESLLCLKYKVTYPIYSQEFDH
jgi:hypothetical protein